METIGIGFLGAAALVLVATQVLFLVAGRRQNVYGVEGENLRLQPKRAAIIGVSTALLLVLLGGVIVGVAAAAGGSR